MEAEFPAIWNAALDAANQHRNLALGMIVRLVKRHVEVAADERERRLTRRAKDQRDDTDR
jgi:hypothetical protein